MSDGRELMCEYFVHERPAVTHLPPEYCYPDETEISDPTYYIDGEEIAYEDLPKGLDVIADKLYYEAKWSPFKYNYTVTNLDDIYDD